MAAFDCFQTLLKSRLCAYKNCFTDLFWPVELFQLHGLSCRIIQKEELKNFKNQFPNDYQIFFICFSCFLKSWVWCFFPPIAKRRFEDK